MNHNQQIRHILALECGAWKNTFFLDKNTHSLGRNSTNSLFCYHRVISRNHANFIRVDYQDLVNKSKSKSTFWLIDGDLTGKKSTNGIYVNGKKCLSHLLKPGDLIFFGGIDVKAKYDILDLQSHNFYSNSATQAQSSLSLDSFAHKLEDSLPIQLDASQLNNFELISDTILLVDYATKTIIYANSSASSLLGYSLAEIQGLKITDIDKVEPSIITHELESLQNHSLSSQRESAYETKEQKMINVLVRTMAVNYEDKECSFIEIKNISNSKKIEDILRYQNNHYALTNFSNQQLFRKQLSYCLGYKKNQETQLAIVKLRLNYREEKPGENNFILHKKIEKKLITHIKKQLPIMDSVAQIAPHEYCIMLEEVKNKARIELLIEQILESIKQPIIIENQSFLLTANMGICIYPQDAQAIDELLQKSSLALEASYDKSLNNYQYYKSDFLQQKNKKYEEEKILSEILDRKSIHIKYQPVINVNDQQIFGLISESLEIPDIIPSGSLVDYLKVAHRIGCTYDLIKFFLETIATDINLWQEKDLAWQRISLPILLSSLLDDHLLNSLLVLWKDFEDRVPNLELDIVIDDYFLCHQELQDLSNLTKITRNLTLSNFDFNPGLKILNYSDFIQNLKISPPADLDLESEVKQKAFITSLLTFTETLNINLIVDNISVAKQKDAFSKMGCKIMAGSNFTPSLSADNLVDFYKNYGE